jgi:hypothetical protein
MDNLLYLTSRHAVAQLAETLRYKLEGRGCDSRWCNWNSRNPSGRTMALGFTQPLTEMTTKNISWGDKGSRCVGLRTLPLSYADCLEN